MSILGAVAFTAVTLVWLLGGTGVGAIYIARVMDRQNPEAMGPVLCAGATFAGLIVALVAALAAAVVYTPFVSWFEWGNS